MANGFVSRFKGKIFAVAASLFQFGAGGASFLSSGNLFRAAYGIAGVNPGATGADNVLAVYSLPANSFDVAGRLITVTAQGSFANNANTKRCKIIFNPSTAVVGSTVGTGGTTIGDTGSYSTTGACGWILQGQVAKSGANGSNTQTGQEMATIINTTHGGCGTPVAITAAENAPILIAITGNATTATTDIALTFAEVTANN